MTYYFAGLVLFLIGAGTDWIDGYYARKYGQVTTLGRILDPFADKVIVCGTFIFLAADPKMNRSAVGTAGVDGGGNRRPGIIGDCAEEFYRRAGQRFFGQVVGQNQDGAAMPCRQRLPVLFVIRQSAGKRSQWCRVLLVVSVWSAVISRFIPARCMFARQSKTLG